MDLMATIEKCLLTGVENLDSSEESLLRLSKESRVVSFVCLATLRASRLCASLCWSCENRIHSPELQIRGGIKDNSKIFSYFSMETYVVTHH